jgi:competence ComEA-like helix-hairpin-helix protein
LLWTAFAVASDLPDGKGKDAVENACSDCHSLERIKAERRNEEGWNSLIHEMLENGAPINANDMPVIVSYLAKNFGPDKKVNINKAAANEIAGVLKLESAEVAAVIQYRTEHGKFKDLSELEKVSGAAGKIEARKALIEF